MDWNALIAVFGGVQAVAVVVALLFARRQVAEAAATRNDQSRAYVVAFLSTQDELESFPYLEVKNFGNTAAYDIGLSFEPVLRSSFDEKSRYTLDQVGFIASGIPTLVPGDSVRTLFDSMYERPQDWEREYVATVSYNDRLGLPHADRFVLDLASRRNATYMTEKGLRSINKHLEKLVKEIHHIRTGFGSPLPVVTETRAEFIERREQRRRPKGPGEEEDPEV